MKWRLKSKYRCGFKDKARKHYDPEQPILRCCRKPEERRKLNELAKTVSTEQLDAAAQETLAFVKNKSKTPQEAQQVRRGFNERRDIGCTVLVGHWSFRSGIVLLDRFHHVTETDFMKEGDNRGQMFTSGHGPRARGERRPTGHTKEVLCVLSRALRGWM